MALATINSPFAAPGAPAPGTFDPTKIAQQMQTDPNVRTMFAQFFGDPASRQFVQDSGNITSAMARPDNPWTPGTPMVATPSTTSPGASFSSAAGPSGETGVAPGNPQAANIAQFFGQPPTSGAPHFPAGQGIPIDGATDAAAAPTPGASLASRAPDGTQPPAAAPGTPQPAGMPPTYATAGDYGAAHPEDVMMPARPVAPMDNVHGARKALMLAFLGLNKFGAGLDHQQNSYADEFLGRQMQQTQAQSQYDASAPQLKHQADEAAYNNYLGQQSKATEIAEGTARAGLTTAQTGSYIGPVQQAGEKVYQDLLGHWQSRDVPDFPSYAKAILAGQPAAVGQYVQSKLNNIYQVPQTGKGYTVDMQDDAPKSISMYGKTYPATVGKDGKLGAPSDPSLPPQAIQDFNSAEAAHQQKFQEGQTVANEAATRQGAAQGRGFTQAATMQENTAELAKETERRKGMVGPSADLSAAQNNQQMIDQLGNATDHASRSALVDQLAQALAPAGSKRLQPAAIDQLMDSGSVSEQAGQKLKKWLSGAGPLPDETVPDWVSAAKVLNNNKIQNAQETLQRNDQTWNNKYAASGPTWKAQVAPTGGGGATQQPGGGPPAGATHTAMGSDGKRHYTNAQGQDLGVAQ